MTSSMKSTGRERVAADRQQIVDIVGADGVTDDPAILEEVEQ